MMKHLLSIFLLFGGLYACPIWGSSEDITYRKVEIETLPEEVQSIVKKGIEMEEFEYVKAHLPYEMPNTSESLMYLAIDVWVCIFLLLCGKTRWLENQPYLANFHVFLGIVSFLALFWLLFVFLKTLFLSIPEYTHALLTDKQLLLIPSEDEKEVLLIPYTDIQSIKQTVYTTQSDQGTSRDVKYHIKTVSFGYVTISNHMVEEGEKALHKFKAWLMCEVKKSQKVKSSQSGLTSFFNSYTSKAQKPIAVSKETTPMLTKIMERNRGRFSKIYNVYKYYQTENMLAFFAWFVATVLLIESDFSAKIANEWAVVLLKIFGTLLLTVLLIVVLAITEKKSTICYLATDAGLLIIEIPEGKDRFDNQGRLIPYLIIGSIEYRSDTSRTIESGHINDEVRWVIEFDLTNGESFLLESPTLGKEDQSLRSLYETLQYEVDNAE